MGRLVRYVLQNSSLSKLFVMNTPIVTPRCQLRYAGSSQCKNHTISIKYRYGPSQECKPNIHHSRKMKLSPIWAYFFAFAFAFSLSFFVHFPHLRSFTTYPGPLSSLHFALLYLYRAEDVLLPALRQSIIISSCVHSSMPRRRPKHPHTYFTHVSLHIVEVRNCDHGITGCCSGMVMIEGFCW
jgi:hypothetical protein